MDFHDPNAPDFWGDWLLYFQNEYAVLSIPTKRIILSVDAIHRLGKVFDIAGERQALIDSLSNRLLESSVQALEIWKRY